MRAYLLCLLAVAAVASEVKENTKNHNRRHIIADPPVPSIEVLETSSVSFVNDHSDSGLAGGYSARLNPPVGGDSSTLDSALSAAVASEYSPGLTSGVGTGYATGWNAGPTSEYAQGLNAELVNGYTANGLDNGIVRERQIINANGPVPKTIVNRVVQVAVPVPQPVEVPRNVPVRVPVPVQVEHRRPVPVRVLQPYPVHVNRPYLVNVDRPVPVPVLHAVRVTYPRVAVPVPVPQVHVVPLQPASGLPWAASSSPLNYADQAAAFGAYASSSGNSGLKSYAAINGDNSAGWTYGVGASNKW